MTILVLIQIIFALSALFDLVLGVYFIVKYILYRRNPYRKIVLILDESGFFINKKNAFTIPWENISKIHLEHYITGSGKHEKHHRKLYFCDDPHQQLLDSFYKKNTKQISSVNSTSIINDTLEAEFDFFMQLRKFYAGPIIKEYENNEFQVLKESHDGQLFWEIEENLNNQASKKSFFFK